MHKNIAIFTGSRGEWGYLRPVLAELKRRSYHFNIIVSNMHLLPESGFTYQEIEKDGFEIAEKIYMNIVGPDHISWAKSLGLLGMQLPDILSKIEADIILLAGDRAETFVAAQAAYYSDIPVAHIQAGERSGHKDGMVRHAIGKLTHIHFASNEDAGDRLKRFGEQEFRIHVVGAPQLDDIKKSNVAVREEIEGELKIKIDTGFALCVVHPTSEDPEECQQYVEYIAQACNLRGIKQVWIYPNNDSGSSVIISKIQQNLGVNSYAFRSVSRRMYLSLLYHSLFIIGNSSSGVLEAPTFKIPAINLGVRQMDRLAADSVLTVRECNLLNIGRSIDVVTDSKFRESIINVKNPYGDGDSAVKIVDILCSVDLNAKMKNKYIEE
jgi:GDP/UDP-N,N'-diacetylbacillosamine 2-epimerase (hydrolysing)